MVNISIINKQSAYKKMKKYLKFGLAAATAYGAIWTAPRIMNQISLPKHREELSSLLVKHDYRVVPNIDHEAALARFEEIASDGFIIPGTVEKERSDLFEKIRKEKSDRFNEIINYNLYKSASHMLDEFRGEPFFTQNDFDIIERKLESIHPDTLMEQAERETDLYERLKLFTDAAKIYRSMEIDKPEIRDKKFATSLEIFVTEQDVTMDIGFFNLKRVISNSDQDEDEKLELTGEQYDRFFMASDSFLENKVFGEPINAEFFAQNTEEYISLVSKFYDSLEIDGKEEKIKDYANMAVDHVGKKIGIAKTYSSNEIDLVARTLDINKTYSLGRETEIVRFYLTAEERIRYSEGVDNLKKQLLNNALMYSQSLTETDRGSIQKTIADGYVSIAEGINGNSSTRNQLLYSALGIYTTNGIEISDSKIKNVIWLIENVKINRSDNESNN